MEGHSGLTTTDYSIAPRQDESPHALSARYTQPRGHPRNPRCARGRTNHNAGCARARQKWEKCDSGAYWPHTRQPSTGLKSELARPGFSLNKAAIPPIDRATQCHRTSRFSTPFRQPPDRPGQALARAEGSQKQRGIRRLSSGSPCCRLQGTPAAAANGCQISEDT